jgi:hypothetical protein
MLDTKNSTTKKKGGKEWDEIRLVREALEDKAIYFLWGADYSYIEDKGVCREKRQNHRAKVSKRTSLCARRSKFWKG